MKIDFTTVLKAPDGSPVIKIVKEEGKPNKSTEMTLLSVAQDALLNDTKAKGNEKYEMYKLCLKIEDPQADLTVKEVSTIKDAINESFNVWVAGVSWDILESKK